MAFRNRVVSKEEQERLDNEKILYDFLDEFGNHNIDSFYEGKEFVNKLRNMERLAHKLGTWTTIDFYNVISGVRLQASVKYYHDLYESLMEQNQQLRKEIFDMKPTEEQFRIMLDKHDWTYAYSDDQSVWRAGVDYEKKLFAFIEEHPDKKELLKQMYNDAHKVVFKQ